MSIKTALAQLRGLAFGCWRTLTRAVGDVDEHLTLAEDGWPCFRDVAGHRTPVPMWLLSSHQSVVVGDCVYTFSQRAVVVVDRRRSLVYTYVFPRPLVLVDRRSWYNDVRRQLDERFGRVEGTK